MTSNNDKEDTSDDSNNDDSSSNEKDVNLGDLTWRVEKLRLEERNKRQFLKARPRFLPYEECRKWVIAFNRWETQEEWEEWIRDGEKRNSYVPSEPQRYYSRTGHWISWEHFLGRSSNSSKTSSSSMSIAELDVDGDTQWE